MTERPILFSAPMVQAILDGRKTMTRRVVKLPGWAQECNEDNEFELDGNPPWPHAIARKTGCLAPLTSPYGQPGDRLWVREAWRVGALSDNLPPRDINPKTNTVFYEADGNAPEWVGRYRPPMFMPRWASRITLEITAVRVERLNEISEQDAVAEGIAIRRSAYGIFECQLPDGKTHFDDSATDLFRKLWESINGPGSWAINPWVWAMELKRP